MMDIVNKNIFSMLCGALVLLLLSCGEQKKTDIKITPLGEADARSAEIATKMMEAMGGEKAWHDTRYLSWTFFGNRKLIWDKHGDRVRIENPKDTTIHLLDMKTMQGRFSKNGVEVTDPQELEKQMKRAKSIWINDSYWLVMPFKLRDEGVHLSYVRKDTIQGGKVADVLALTFTEVGDTPENKYEVYVDASDNLIKKWSFYAKADQEEPSRSWPWDNYKKYGNILLSADRSDRSGPSAVVVDGVVSDKVFEEF